MPRKKNFSLFKTENDSFLRGKYFFEKAFPIFPLKVFLRGIGENKN